MIDHEYPEFVVEELAGLMHQIWTSWMEYLFSKCETVTVVQHHSIDASQDLAVLCSVPRESELHWRRQMMTMYADLTDKEKDSDRKQALKVLGLLKRITEPPPTSPSWAADK